MEFKWGDSPKDDKGKFIWPRHGQTGWEKFTLPGTPPGREKNRVLWIRAVLPEGNGESPAILTSGIHQVCEVYLGGKKIYQFGRFDESGSGVFEGYKWFHLIPLPPGYGAQTVYFRIYSDFQSIGFSGASIDSSANHLRRIVRYGILKFMVGVTFLILGFLALIYYAARLRRGKDEINRGSSIFLFFIVTSVFIGIAVIADTRIKELIVEAPMAWLYVRLAGIYLFIFGLAGFIYHAFESRFGWMIKSFCAVYLAYAVISLSLAAAGVIPVMSTILPFNILVIAGSAAVILVIAGSFRKGSREAYIFTAGVLFFAFTGVRDALVDMGVLPRYEFIQHWGMLAFVVSLGIIIVSRIFEFNRRYYGYTHELALARSIQMSIMPKEDPSFPGIKVASVYLPMESVGGDYFDFHRVSDRKLGIFISDISGHGIPSALISSMVKVIFDYESGITDNPAHLLAGMNSKLHLKMDNNFLTASYALLDLDRGTMHMANAGHPPLLLWRGRTGEILEFKPKGKLMGCFTGMAYESQETGIEPGDKVIFYTDGIQEARNAQGELFGRIKFHEYIRGKGDLPAGEFARDLIRMIERWTRPEKKFTDDITLVVVDIGTVD